MRIITHLWTSFRYWLARKLRIWANVVSPDSFGAPKK